MNFQIDNDKFNAVVAIFRDQVDVHARALDLRNTVTADWNEGAEHQEWLDTADAQEIVDWLASFYN